MARNVAAGMLVGLFLICASSGWSQRGSARDGGMDNGNVNFNYSDISRRNTARSERDDKKAKEAEEAKKKAEEEKRRAERDKRSAEDAAKRGVQKPSTSMTSKSSTGTKTAAKPGGKPANGRATQPVNTGGTDPTAREVTEVMLEAVQTQKVTFDAEAAKNDPNILILNAPRFDATKRTRAGDASGIAKPL